MFGAIAANRKRRRETIDTDAPWLNTRDLQQIFAAIAAAGGEVRVVGGAVRDHLLGRPIKDVDLATTLQPDAVIEAAAQAGLRTIPTGMDHGTVSFVINGQTYETTTLRADVETDGRHAVVRYTDNWAEDARRRDLTMNALYLDPHGVLHDPLGQGEADARAGIIRFIGDATERIREDYLRILRFFRFHAQLGWPIRDAVGLAACTAEAEGLRQLSVERVWQEMLLLLSAPAPLQILQAMRTGGVLNVVAPEIDPQRPLPVQPDAVLRLAALIETRDAADALARRWKLSKADASRLSRAKRPAGDAFASVRSVRHAIYRDGRQAITDRAVLADLAGQPVSSPVLAEIDVWAPPVFPVTGRDLIQAGMTPGPELGRALKALERRWLQDDFRASRDTCVGWLPEVLSELPEILSGLTDPESSPRRS
ncbi:MAG: CCA tRNA nucleotidyltransferase [Minwuia sp.]|nr:CCA tRNA nucleotidyltransferase [Minwuia sp.]